MTEAHGPSENGTPVQEFHKDIGGSTPSALRAYGIKEGAWSTEEQMFAIVHQMRTRIVTSPAFTGKRIIGAILFENTIDRDIEGTPAVDYLWNVKRVVPF